MDINIDNIHLSTEEGTHVAVIENKAYKINSAFYKVLSTLNTGIPIEDAIRNVATETGIDYHVLLNKFTTFIKKAHKIKDKSYIRFKHIIIKEKVVNKIAYSLTFLYANLVFAILLFICLITNIVFLCRNYRLLDGISCPTFEIGFVIFLGYLLSLIIHEIGHATATISIGKRAKEIGFGFYMMFPVFYTDVTSAWNMKKKERILVNIGGIYFQLIVNTIVIVILSLFPQYAWIKALNGLVISNAFVVVISITPFFRNDGYWILSDYWGIPNLLKKSDYTLLHLFDHPRNKSTKNINRLMLFGLANNLFRIYILVCLALNIQKNLTDIIGHTYQNRIPNILISIVFSIIGIYMILASYYKMLRHEGQNGY